MAGKKRVGLVAKFNLLTALMVLATSLGITFFFVHQEAKNTYDTLLHHGKVLAGRVSQNSEYAVYTENRDSLDLIVSSLTDDPNLAYAAVTNSEGKVLVSRIYKGQALIPPLVAHDGSSKETTHREIRNEWTENLVDIVAPVLTSSIDKDNIVPCR